MIHGNDFKSEMKISDLKSLEISPGQRSYPIHVGRGLDDLLADQISGCKKVNKSIALITDDRLQEVQQEFIQKHFAEVPTFILPNGETHKNLQHFIEAQEYFAGLSLDRSTVMFAFGGGVVGDFAGFVAAAYMRGVDFVQIPTTLLSMVDSSVGGKTGVNLRAGKNLVGAFHQPEAVYIDLNRLQSLDSRQFSAGMAEIIKAGLLADVSFFEKLESLDRLDAQSPELADVIHHSCSIKAGVVAADEKEQATSGGRALLNLGHTFGHAIEQTTNYTEYLHGEAISIGMMMAAELSRQLGYIETDEVSRIQELLKKYELPTELKNPIPCESLMIAMGRDKKKRQGTLKYVVLEKLGQAITRADISEKFILHALKQGGAE